MENEELLERIYNLQTESSERDARLEVQMTDLRERMDKNESLLEKMSDILSEHKHLSASVDVLAKQIGEVKDAVRVQGDEIKELKNAPAKKTHEVVNKILWIAIPVFVTAFCGGVVAYVTKLLRG